MLAKKSNTVYMSIKSRQEEVFESATRSPYTYCLKTPNKALYMYYRKMFRFLNATMIFLQNCSKEKNCMVFCVHILSFI